MRGMDTVAEWTYDQFSWAEEGRAVVHSLMMIAILVLSFAGARRFLGTMWHALFARNTDERVYCQAWETAYQMQP